MQVMLMEGTRTQKNTWQSLSLATERLLTTEPDCSGADQNQGRDEDEGEKYDDEAVNREIARIEARLRWLNWLEFVLRRKPQRQ